MRSRIRIRIPNVRANHSLYHRLFAAARWSLDHVGLVIFAVTDPWLGETAFLAIDDTLARKRGLKMFGTGACTAIRC